MQAGAIPLRDRLAATGFVHIPAGGYDLDVVLRDLGQVVDRTTVSLRPDINTYLCQPESIPPHTDHPVARWIAWRCVEQDAVGGDQWLVDGHAALAQCDASTTQVLTRTLLPARRRSGCEVAATPIVAQVVEEPHIFFAPWLTPLRMDPDIALALNLFKRLVSPESGCQHHSIRITPGDVLVVDNHRILHGRPAIAQDSRRRLDRFWIADRP